tara:strand:+ start:179 stop:877 length:699 start_codon:yes stop_codon:yes gene_type:complete
MTSQARVDAGRKAKKDGHIKETALSKKLTEQTGYKHETDGGNKTKQDILCKILKTFYSQKSASSKHTQVHLTPTRIWCKYFNIDGDLRTWFDKFFGEPLSGREGRLGSSDIPDSLNQLALDWFNDNKMSIFDVIVRHGAYDIDGEIKKGESVTHVIWYNKRKDIVEKVVTVDYLADLVRGGKWTLNETTLHFHDKNGDKLFHLQMKGSGRNKKTGKPTGQFNSLQFHIYKVC